jgi:uncharacterized protein (TIGR02466 family)
MAPMSGSYQFGAGFMPKAPPKDRVPERVLQVEPLTLFPTRIWQARLTALAPRFPTWIAAVEALRASAPEPAGRSNRGGWNSADKAVFDQPAFADLQAGIRAACDFALRQMGVTQTDYRLESWINIHDRGGFNFLHMHDGCLLSGAFYLQVPPGSGCLSFRDPRPGVVNSPFKGAGANGHGDVQLTPEAGLAVLFPNWLEHYVEPHDNDIPRISLSFNALSR